MVKVPPSWRDRFAAVLHGYHRLTLDVLLDPDDVVRAGFVAGFDPQKAARIDAVDAALGRWLKKLSPVTRASYQRNMRMNAQELGVVGIRPVRAVIDQSIEHADDLELRLADYVRTTDAKVGTVRMRLSAWRSASYALFRARLAHRPLEPAMPPRDTDTTPEPTSHRAILCADRYCVDAGTSFAIRDRVALHLAISGLRTHEIADLSLTDVSLQTHRVRVGDEAIRLTESAVTAIAAWIQLRGASRGPLLLAINRHTNRPTSSALGPRGIERGIEAIGEAIGEDLDVRALRRRAVVDAPTTREAQRAARVRNPCDVYRLRSPRSKRDTAPT